MTPGNPNFVGPLPPWRDIRVGADYWNKRGECVHVHSTWQHGVVFRWMPCMAMDTRSRQQFYLEFMA